MIDRRIPLGICTFAFAMSLVACGAGDGDGIRIPADSSFVVRLDEPIDSEDGQPGQILSAVIEVPIVSEGVALLDAGLPATVAIVEAHPAREEALARLTLQLETLTVDGRSVDVEAAPLRLVGHSWTDLGEHDEGLSGLAGRAPGGVESAKSGGVLGTTARAVIAIDTQDDAIRLGRGQTLLFRSRSELTLPSR